MAHVQQQILDAIQAALTGVTVASTRVFVDRLDPLEAIDLPAILIEEAPQGERAQLATIGGLEQRDLQVRVAGVVAHATNYAKDARALGLEIEKVLGGLSPTLDALAKGGRRITLSQLVASGETDQARAARQQYWQFTYFVFPGSPDVAA